MKPKLKLYLDTSVISALFDERNPERKSLTESFFKERDQFRIFVSNITIAEIEKTPDEEIKFLMNQTIAKFPILEVSDDVEDLT